MGGNSGQRSPAVRGRTPSSADHHHLDRAHRHVLDSLREATGGKGSELFLFIEEETLRKSNPLDALWVTGNAGRLMTCRRAMHNS
jgi:hypothetical protein